MGRGIGLGALVIGSLSLWLSACSGSSKPSNGSSPCDAGERRCDGSSVKQCSADGSTEITVEICAAGQSCADGACEGTACVPNTKFCKDGAIRKCDSTGDGSSLAQTCASGTYCSMDDDEAECRDASCQAGDAVCDGDVATKCKADGSGPALGGTDCAAQGQICQQGECRAQSCLPGEKLCQQGDVYLCASSGTSTSLLVDCAAGDVCDGTSRACKTRVCEPGELDCEGSRVVRCNEYGSAWQQPGTDCAADGKVCASGACHKQVCTANGTFCEEGNVHKCDATGTSSVLSLTCTPSYYHCVEYAGGNYAQCLPNACTPGQAFCDDNWVRTCNADGTYPDTGTACGSENYCDAGTCQPRVCTPYEYSCNDGDIYYCDDRGALSYLWQECVDDTVCQPQGDGGAACIALPCEPGATACIANKIGTCSTDGSSLESVSGDCPAAGNVCTAGKTCAKASEDTLGLENELEVQPSGMGIGDIVDVMSARKLTKLDANLVLVAPRDLRWVVFEQVGGNFVARIDKVVANQMGSEYFSSGQLDYTLKAGKRYLLGVVVTGGSFGSLYDVAPWAPGGVSFGRAIGGYPFYYSPSISATDYLADRLYQMRLTTELP